MSRIKTVVPPKSLSFYEAAKLTENGRALCSSELSTDVPKKGGAWILGDLFK